MMDKLLGIIEVIAAIIGTVKGLLGDVLAAHATGDQAKLDEIRARLDGVADALAAPGPGG